MTIALNTFINHVKGHLNSRGHFCTAAGNEVNRLHVRNRGERHDNLSLMIECDDCDIKNFCSVMIRADLFLKFVEGFVETSNRFATHRSGYINQKKHRQMGSAARMIGDISLMVSCDIALTSIHHRTKKC